MIIDWLSLSWAIIKFKTQPSQPPTQPASQPPTHPGNNFSELNWDPSLSLDWLYLSFHWSECDQNFRDDQSQVPDHIQIKIKMPNPSQEPSLSSKAPNQDLKTWMFFASSKSISTAKIQIMGVSKTSDHIQIKIKRPNLIQEPPAPTKISNKDLKDMDDLCTSKIKIER